MRKPRAGKSQVYLDISVALSTLERTTGVSNYSSRLKSVSAKLRFRGGLISVDGKPNRKNKLTLRFQISPKLRGLGPSPAYLLLKSRSEDKVILCPRI